MEASVSLAVVNDNYGASVGIKADVGLVQSAVEVAVSICAVVRSVEVDANKTAYVVHAVAVLELCVRFKEKLQSH